MNACNHLGVQHYFLISMMLALLSSANLQAQQLSSVNLYDPGHIVEVQIEIAAEDWKQLCSQSRDPGKVFIGKVEDPFTYFKADLTIDGQKVKSVGVRKKGFIGSLDFQFPSLKVKFDEYEKQQPIKDVDVLTLNNNKQDGSLLSQYMAYRLFNAASVHAPRSNFAKVTVNGKYLGLYSNVESIGKPFLERQFGDGKGNLYEGTLADFYPKAIDRLEVKTNKKNHDNSKITRLSELLSAQGALDLKAVDEIVDLDNFVRYWTIESLIGFWDGYCNNQNNYWVYESPKNGKLYFIPWGADAAFMTGGFPGFGPQGPVAVYVESMLANRLYREAVISARYKETMQAVLETLWLEDVLIKAIDDMEQFLKPHLHARQSGAPRAMESMRQFIKRRQKTIEGGMATWPVEAPATPRKPMYVVSVGQAKGSFTATWSDRPTRDVAGKGQLEMQLTLAGEVVTLEKTGVSLTPPDRSGFGGLGGPFASAKPTGNVTLVGTKTGDSTPFQLVLSIPLEQLEQSAGKTITVDGNFSDNMREGAPSSPFGSKTVSGTVTFSKVGFKSDETIAGQFDLTIAEVHGGFFNRGR